MMPTTIVNANPCSTSPPKKNSASAVRSAVPDVMTVRPSVWLTETLITLSSESRRIDAQVLADPVEDDDRVVGRIAGHRQYRGDDVQRHVVAEERQERERDEQVVHGRDHRADAEAELEAEREVQQDADERQHRRPGFPSSPARARPSGRRSPRPAGVKLPTLPFFSASSTCCAVVLSDAPDSAPTFGTRIITSAATGRRTPGRRRSGRRPGYCGRARSRTCSHRHRLIELLDDHGAAGELDALRNPLRRERDHARDDDDPGERDRVPAPAEEIEVRVLENMHG